MSKHILDFIKNSPYVLSDGAMGTYYAEISGNSTDRCELANIETPGIIKSIHEEYIAAGSQLLRTNTFAANTWFLKKDVETVKEVICKGFEIASLAADAARELDHPHRRMVFEDSVRERALEMLKGSDMRLGKLQTLRQGVFQITQPHSTEVSSSGIHDTSTKKKQISVTAHATFAIK